MTYLDTSVLAAYYCPEDRSEKAERLVTGCRLPAISPLVEVELASAVARKVREGGLRAGDAVRILAQFRLHVEAGCYECLPVKPEHFEVARDWISRLTTPMRTLDALHLAVCFSAAATVVTADDGMAKAARHLGVRVEQLAS